MKRWPCVWAAVFVIGSSMSTQVFASPLLKCHFEVNAERLEKTFTPTTDPYAVSSVNLEDRFRFKAVVLMADETRVASVNLYVSYQTRRQPMVIQHISYVAPQALSQPSPDALTGRVAVYSPFLGKELLYGCALHEVAP